MSAVAALGLAAALALAAQPAWMRWRRARVLAQPFPSEWRRILRKRVPAVAHLPADLQRKLKKHIQVFLAEKAFVGCKGQAITDQVRVTIAAQVCLLLLGRNVVLHEFAHQIDQDTGHADGRPWQPTAGGRRRWSAVMVAAFAQLQQQPSAVIDAYGATDPAEFFAVATEVFLSGPRRLQPKRLRYSVRWQRCTG